MTHPPTIRGLPIQALTKDRPLGVLFVCLGNICRSPLARNILEHAARGRGVLDRLRVDSCGTGGWHVGDPADPRTVAVARRRGLPFHHVARQVRVPEDFREFDLIIAMDHSNLRTLRRLGAPEERLRLMRWFSEPDRSPTPEVPDPYTGDDRDFDHVYDLLERACGALLDALALPSDTLNGTESRP
jgi:protein-tyrosine phosphatase